MAMEFGDLPVELVQQIFLATIGCGTNGRMPDMTQVCRSWRTIAIGTPALWTTIRTKTLLYKKIAEAHLEHAKDVPLHVIYRLQGNALPHASTLARILSKTKRFEAQGGRISSSGLNTGPRLKRDSLTIRDLMRSNFEIAKVIEVAWKTRLYIPTIRLDALDAPHLKALHVDGLALLQGAVRKGRLDRLVALHVSRLPERRDVHLGGVLTVLTSLPVLTSLFLDRAIPSLRPSDARAYPQFWNLEELTLHAPISRVASLLPILNAPALKILRALITVPQGTDEIILAADISRIFDAGCVDQSNAWSTSNDLLVDFDIKDTVALHLFTDNEMSSTVPPSCQQSHPTESRTLQDDGQSPLLMLSFRPGDVHDSLDSAMAAVEGAIRACVVKHNKSRFRSVTLRGVHDFTWHYVYRVPSGLFRIYGCNKRLNAWATMGSNQLGIYADVTIEDCQISKDVRNCILDSGQGSSLSIHIKP